MPLLLLLLGFWLTPLHAETPLRQEAVLVKKYHGAHEADFTSQFDRVRLLVNQAQLEVSSRLGLIQYREGFQFPMQISFRDGAPGGIENALAYVQLGKMSDGSFAQELVVNLEALAAHPMDFDTVFYHEMTHAVMNDAVGGEASLKIPHWLEEGLAVWISGEGDDRVKRIAEHLHKSEAGSLVFPLGGPVYGAAYPQYYLAIKYLLKKHSINAVQGIVRDLIAGKSIEESIQDCTSLTWEQYRKSVAAFSLKTFQDIAIPDGVVRR